MASIIANGPGTPLVTRGKGTKVGTLPVNASTTAVQFTVSQLVGNPNGFDNLLIFCVGGTVTTPVLEVSIDGGATWATVSAPGASSSATPVTNSTFATDPAVSSANSYIIGGLSGLGLFRFGAAITVAPSDVWVAIAG